jgi:MMPL family
VAVFAGFVGNDNTTIKTLGFGLAAGIFMDAFFVRLMVVPSVMTILGKAVWWFPARQPGPADGPAPVPILPDAEPPKQAAEAETSPPKPVPIDMPASADPPPSSGQH